MSEFPIDVLVGARVTMDSPAFAIASRGLRPGHRMPRRRVRRKVRQLMRHAAELERYGGPVKDGWREHVQNEIRAWVACLR